MFEMLSMLQNQVFNLEIFFLPKSSAESGGGLIRSTSVLASPIMKLPLLVVLDPG